MYLEIKLYKISFYLDSIFNLEKYIKYVLILHAV